MRKITSTILLAIAFLGNAFAQNCSSLNMQHQADIASTCNFEVLTMIHDVQNRPYLHVANKEGGLKIYDISNLAAPSLSASIPTTLFDTLDVMSLSQYGNYLYLALGNSFTNPQQGGMAIVDITNPLLPAVTDFYIVPGSASGGGIVKVEDDYAYLGAMKSGLVILDVSNKNNIQFVSQLVPSINFPPISNPNPNYYNARGMEVRNSIVYLCYDGGGLRIINCSNKNAPVETGRWCNPVMYSPLDHPKAYNNIVLDDTLAYIAVDYAGMEVLNISDTSNITLHGWWNPYNAPNNNWFTSPSHLNEIILKKDCNLIFMSSGKSDMMVVDISNPALPDSCNFYGGTANNIGTWGIGMWQNQIYLSYICAVIPFSSNWTGVKILTYDTCTATTGISEAASDEQFSIYPNPFSELTVLETNKVLSSATLTVYNSFGQQVKQIQNICGKSVSLYREGLAGGLYFVHLTEDNKTILLSKLVIIDK